MKIFMKRWNISPTKWSACIFQASDLVVLPYNEITQSGVLQIAYAFWQTGGGNSRWGVLRKP
jgi:hypothetical protein